MAAFSRSGVKGSRRRVSGYKRRGSLSVSSYTKKASNGVILRVSSHARKSHKVKTSFQNKAGFGRKKVNASFKKRY